MYKELFEKIAVSESLRQKIEERIDCSMKSKKRVVLKTAVIAACLVLALSAAAAAAYRCLSASRAAQELGDKSLAKSFENETASAFAQDGPYRAELLGVKSGENLSDFTDSAWEVSPERTYAVLAVEKIDGTDMTEEDELMVSPLIGGLDPMRFNVFSLGGSSSKKIVDGVLYNIVECDSVECLADRPIYLAVYEGMVPNSAYSMDEKTGEITPKSDFSGTNMLIKLDIDPKKADPEKARELIARVNEALPSEPETDSAELSAAEVEAAQNGEEIVLQKAIEVTE